MAKVWVHAIFGTKNRTPVLKRDLAMKVCDHMRSYLEELGCGVRTINGTSDHVHMLFLMAHDKSISQIMKSVKGESSHWINQRDFLKLKFAWQVGYGAFSVSESNVRKVENYIARQKEHHRKISFREEYEMFLHKHGLLDKIGGNR